MRTTSTIHTSFFAKQLFEQDVKNGANRLEKPVRQSTPVLQDSSNRLSASSLTPLDLLPAARFKDDTLIPSRTVYADWCGPCKQIAPIYEQLSAQLSRPNKITFAKVNTEQQGEVAKQYGVTA